MFLNFDVCYIIFELLNITENSLTFSQFHVFRKVERMAGFSSRVSALLDTLEKQSKEKDKSQQFCEIKDGPITFSDLTYCAPDKTPLINNLDLEIKENHNILITGNIIFHIF